MLPLYSFSNIFIMLLIFQRGDHNVDKHRIKQDRMFKSNFDKLIEF